MLPSTRHLSTRHRGLGAAVARAGDRLPRGWGDLFLQASLGIGFILAYQVVRGLAQAGPKLAFANGRLLIGAERGLHVLFEPALQRFVLQSELLVQVLNWTYWFSQFLVVGAAAF